MNVRIKGRAVLMPSWIEPCGFKGGGLRPRVIHAEQVQLAVLC